MKCWWKLLTCSHPVCVWPADYRTECSQCTWAAGCDWVCREAHASVSFSGENWTLLWRGFSGTSDYEFFMCVCCAHPWYSVLTLCTRLSALNAQEAGCHAHLHHFLLLLLEVVSDIRGHTYSCGNIVPITDVCTHVCPLWWTPSIYYVWAQIMYMTLDPPPPQVHTTTLMLYVRQDVIGTAKAYSLGAMKWWWKLSVSSHPVCTWPSVYQAEWSQCTRSWVWLSMQRCLSVSFSGENWISWSGLRNCEYFLLMCALCTPWHALCGR